MGSIAPRRAMAALLTGGAAGALANASGAAAGVRGSRGEQEFPQLLAFDQQKFSTPLPDGIGR